jgi:hypothetical protein
MAHNSKLKSIGTKVCNHKALLNEHDLGVVTMMSLLPTSTFHDGVDSSAFMLDSALIGTFVGPELGGVISSLSNGFDFGF